MAGSPKARWLLEVRAVLEHTFSAKRPRVVFAEDDDLIRFSVASALREEGCRVIAVKNGAALGAELEAAFATDEPPAAVIADDRMPGASGLAVLERARSWGWTVPLVLMTGYADRDVLDRARRAAVYVLRKPVDLDPLCSMVRSLLTRDRPLRCAACGSTEDLRPAEEDGAVCFCAECRTYFEDLDPTSPRLD